MAVKHVMLAWLVWATVAVQAGAQGVTAEISTTGGVSSDHVLAAATQARLFGEVRTVRFFAEGAWTRSTEREDGQSSEAFTTAYPYEGPPRLMDAYAERRFGNTTAVASLRGGRLRTPFGIYDASDHAYNGFLRAPLIRYEGYWSLTNSLLEHGVNLMAGTSWLQGEVTVGRSADVSDDLVRRDGTNVVLRGQAYYRTIVVGVSHLRSQAYDLHYATGKMIFTGIDVRWMYAGVQLRGEWLVGRPWDGTSTVGGYVDVLVHRPAMGPLTLVARVETLDYDTPDPSFADAASGIALGGRLKLADGLHAQLNVTHRPSAPYGQNVTATDAAVTYTFRFLQ